jgi:hypothetical protein
MRIDRLEIESFKKFARQTGASVIVYRGKSTGDRCEN